MTDDLKSQRARIRPTIFAYHSLEFYLPIVCLFWHFTSTSVAQNRHLLVHSHLRQAARHSLVFQALHGMLLTFSTSLIIVPRDLDISDKSLSVPCLASIVSGLVNQLFCLFIGCRSCLEISFGILTASISSSVVLECVRVFRKALSRVLQMVWQRGRAKELPRHRKNSQFIASISAPERTEGEVLAFGFNGSLYE